jgi:tRNA(Ile)-lysidine synthase
MSPLEEYIGNVIQKYHPKQCFVACSGGIDSMVLIHLLLKNGVKPHLLHVNYGLRGEESDGDEQFLRQFASDRSLKITVRTANIKEQLDQEGGNLQQEARKLRYGFFEEKTDESDMVFLAHHADDQLENFFLSLGRGATISGLCGMVEKNGRYIRPLLQFSRKDLLDYARQNKIEWREDSSNSDLKYRRNLLRNQLIPELRTYDPSLDEHVKIVMKAFREHLSEIRTHAKPIAHEWMALKSIPVDHFSELSEEVAGEVLRYMNESPELSTFLKKLCGLAKSKKVESLNIKGRSYIRSIDTIDIVDEESSQIVIPELLIKKVARLPSKFTKDVLYLDPNKIEGELHLRKWQTGDRMKPIGVPGSKLISDILKDAKQPAHLRASTLVVHDNKKIIWCVDFAVSSEALASEISEILEVRIGD